jgi:hypothetical protein
MKKPLKIAGWAAAALLAFLLQPKITVFGYPLNLTMALVYVFAARTVSLQPGGPSFTDVTAETRVALFGAVIGLIEDMMSGSIPGVNMMSKGLLGLFIVFLYRDIISQWTPVIGAVALFLVTVLDAAVVVTVSQLATDMDINEFAAAQMALAQAAINIPLGCFFRFGQKVSDLKGL